MNAAEAGTNDFWQYLQTTEFEDLECDDRSDESELRSRWTSAYTASVTFYRADGATPVACPLTTADIPAYVKVESTGTAEGEAARTMETYAQLTPVYSGFGAAILAVNGTSFSNNFQVNGQSGNDGDVYILNGNLTITNSPVIFGNVFVPNGSATLSNNSEIKGDLWANGTVTVNNPSKVSGNAKSTTGNIAAAARWSAMRPPPAPPRSPR